MCVLIFPSRLSSTNPSKDVNVTDFLNINKNPTKNHKIKFEDDYEERKIRLPSRSSFIEKKKRESVKQTNKVKFEDPLYNSDDEGMPLYSCFKLFLNECIQF